ncbi:MULTISPECIES: cob(I)yrinic acid a,c-diamide adenosyltransferase [Aneurinibacillus]|uniref:Corrinoid adenosyltransferase n=1 Tax=Aneurinibacillus thermoaerophilus TaxID=143495 RepID=A0A1G8A8T3_ANETH|nr:MULTISPECIES: cob(I)yrinic acid a,c-diamide adenosyltransferase [Aneurinibacillus]AMA74056.1 cob(I)yrinic acid a c-diamide adenosyltransferase [Aneurinibacillus sp. XH2]MED0675427.1 cob(I)yrinic acid a,c-diamide adenosyltransferase [Aneurinibacillus thermoaerophilus]MED0678780.1 cob(I)yrinic acid a,c-diamide adenosyltransferase [Aneurinibacillus thermoaerophilus]MED0736655.1 cob(I)yrinic acid a,c-diamide adenosyltransferase [Aneurinibacillus thermoaerophilus]MED0758310.1 cob(I)yrinic acid a
MKIYTKSGDKGDTSLLYGVRVPKYDARVEAYGTCDEANSAIGVALSYMPQGKEWEEFFSVFHVVQTKLFHIGAELATPAGKEVSWKIEEEDVELLEKMIDKWDAELPVLKNFVLPGGSQAGASLHLARTVVRRAERKAILVREQLEVNPIVIRYLNRLSDFLFVAARYVNHKLGKTEPPLHEN